MSLIRIDSLRYRARDLIRIFVFGFVVTLAVGALPAKATDSSVKLYCFVRLNAVGGPGRYYSTDVFAVENEPGFGDLQTVGVISEEFADFMSDYKQASCERTNQPVETPASKLISRFSTLERVLAWRPASSSNVNGDVKSKYMRFQSPQKKDKEGFTEATIYLKYRFIICAGDVQVAYGIDRSTFNAGDKYEIYTGQSYKVLEGRTTTAPIAVPLNAVVYILNDNYPKARFRDMIVGETLGFDCFTGQTHSLGKVDDFFPLADQKSNLDKKRYLNSLTLDSVLNYIPLVLKANGVTTEQANRDAAEKQAADENAKGEREAVEALNAKNLAKTLEASRAIQAMKEDNARRLAAYERDMAASRAAKAKFEADKAANDNEVAAYEAKRAAYEAEMRSKGLTPQ